MIGTSINIEKRRLIRLRKAVKHLNISENELLSILLQKSRRLFGDTAVTGKTVDYQKNTDTSDFVIYHINLNENDYEFAAGRRYMFKISVSYIFRLAIDAFLSDIIYEWTKNRINAEQTRREYCTNFFANHFLIGHYIIDSVEFWQIPWPRERPGT